MHALHFVMFISETIEESAISLLELPMKSLSRQPDVRSRETKDSVVPCQTVEVGRLLVGCRGDGARPGARRTGTFRGSPEGVLATA